MPYLRKLAIATCVTAITFVASAQTSLVQQAKSALKNATGRDMPVEDVQLLEGGHVYEVRLPGATFLHITNDFKFVIANGSYLKLDSGSVVDLTEQREKQRRQAVVSNIPDNEVIIFKAVGPEKASIDVFGEPNCGYCLKLHGEIPELNAAGVTVRYLAWPRSGLESGESGWNAYDALSHLWCQSDKNDVVDNYYSLKAEASLLSSMDRGVVAGNPEQLASFNQYRSSIGRDLSVPAQQDLQSMLAENQARSSRLQQGLENKRCDAQVADQFHAGVSLGIKGTPALVFPDGSLLPGFVDAARIIRQLGI